MLINWLSRMLSLGLEATIRSEFENTSMKQCKLTKFFKSGPEIVWVFALISIIPSVSVD